METYRLGPTLSDFLGLSSADALICVKSNVLPGDSVLVCCSLIGPGLSPVVLAFVDSEKFMGSSLIVDFLSNLIGLCSTILLSISRADSSV